MDNSTEPKLINNNRSEVCTYYSDFYQIDNTEIDEVTKYFLMSIPAEKYRQNYNINTTNFHELIPKIKILPVSSQVFF